MAPRLPTDHINTIASHTGPVNTIAFSNLGGTYILTGSSDRSIHLSRTEPTSNGKPSTSPIQKYTSHGYAVLSLSVSAQNTHFASGGGDRSIFYWDIQTPGTTLRRFGSNTTQAHTSRITCVSFAGSDDSVLVSGSDDTSVRLWDVKSRDTRPLMAWDEARDGVTGLVVRGVEVICASIDGCVRAYDLRMGTCVVDTQPGPVTSLDLSRDGKVMLTGCLDGRLRVMDRESGACLRSFPPEGKMADAGEAGVGYVNETFRIQSCFGANEALVLSGSEKDGRVRAWDVMTGKQVGNVPVSEQGKVVSVVKWREASKTQGIRELWAAGGADGVVRLYGS